MNHKWDKSGERCLICGDKDWMGGECGEGVNILHVMPRNDFREHDSSRMCWCNPEHKEGVWVHNSMDRREEYEEGRKMS